MACNPRSKALFVICIFLLLVPFPLGIHYKGLFTLKRTQTGNENYEIRRMQKNNITLASLHQNRVFTSYTHGCSAYANSPSYNRSTPKRLRSGNYVCDGLRPFRIYETNDVPTFQQVVQYELWTVSAYLDEREVRGRVTLIGLSSYSFDKKSLHCTLWYDKCKTAISVHAKSKALAHWAPIQKPFKHLGYFIFCDTAMQGVVPDYVSLSTTPCDNPTNLLTVKKLTPYKGPTTIAHCLPAIHGLYNPHRLIEWIAFAQVQGVDHVFVYDTYSISHDVYRVLDHYIRRGFVSVVRWHVQDMMSVRAFAHRTMLNDCAFRAYGRFRFVSNHDLDEVIVPVRAPSLKVLLDEKSSKSGTNLFVFRNAHFCISWGDVSSSDSRIRLLTVLKRKDPDGVSMQKVITSPEISLELGIHNVVLRVGNVKAHNMGMDEAYVHHYRFWDEKSSNCMITDKTALRFEKDLKNKISHVRDILKL